MHEFSTMMPDGECCDVYAVEDCSRTVGARKGKVQVRLAPTSAVALYTGTTKKTHPAASHAVDPSTSQRVRPRRVPPRRRRPVRAVARHRDIVGTAPMQRIVAD
ncbi:hypothetical protein [Bifidobacterium castoris]|uniref:hypothetical protein n=1 Tax=Bifidobacterium castoris TaxID=2306972 RepID=UPI000F7D7D57|nr:hypothetical protein [Bifidobacterium castoris]